MEKKNKVIAIVISIVGIVVITGMIIMQVFMKTNVIERVSQSQEVSEVPKALDVSSWDTSKVTVYTDKSGKKAPIPVGYVASQVTGETEIDTGLVIYEGTGSVTGTRVGVPGTPAWTASCNRNQWVWVPVNDVSRIYDVSARKSKLYSITQTGRSSYSNSNYEPGVLTNRDNERYFSQRNLPGMMRKKLLYEIDSELVETIKSIEKYGGFYIGRYEAGDITAGDSSTYYRKPVERRMNTNINYVSWYDAYMNLRTLGANENVKANMIYGCLWDETLQWFRETSALGEDTAAKLYNSASWGNHFDSEGFTYYSNVSGSTGTRNIIIIVPTGSTERNKANNIYDMAGNVSEWTMEGDRYNFRRYRGGSYSYNASDYSADGRNTYDPESGFNNVRCACVLLHQIEILRSKILFDKHLREEIRTNAAERREAK